MPGFFVSNSNVHVRLQNLYPERCVEQSLDLPNMTLKRNTLDKFMDDKAFSVTENAVLVLDGVLLNKKQLLCQYSANDVASLMWKMYVQKGDTFFNDFRGPFSGALYDRKNNKWLIFTNHCGDAAVFYSVYDGYICAGSDVVYIIDAIKVNAGVLTFDESAAYQMLTYGFMVNNATYAKEIKRLRGGQYICVKDENVEVCTYHQFRRETTQFETSSEDEIVEIIDSAFRNAIALEYDKDREYGYAHLADLSGGLDSRMVMWVPMTMGYNPIQLITYSKSNYADEKIAKEIAEYCCFPLIFNPLDDASFLYDIDEIVRLNCGLSLYSGITGGNRVLKSLNMNMYGLEHTGMIGDVVIGSWWNSEKDHINSRQTGRYSNKLVERLPESVRTFIDSFDDDDIFLDYTRGFQGAANTHLIRRNYTEVTSAFMNVDLLQLCLNIPHHYRYGHGIYKKWIISKYPDAARFVWEKTGGKLAENHVKANLRKIIKKGPQKLLRMLGMHRFINTGMIPLDYWVSKNSKLKAYLDEYERVGYENMPDGVSAQLLDDMKRLYLSGNVAEKSMVLTVLASAKLYFGD